MIEQEQIDFAKRREILKKYIEGRFGVNERAGRVGKMDEVSARMKGRAMLVNIATIGWDRCIDTPSVLRGMIDTLIDFAIDDDDLMNKLEAINEMTENGPRGLKKGPLINRQINEAKDVADEMINGA